MRILRDFQCEVCGHIEEHLVGADKRYLKCENCNGVSRIMMGRPRIALEGISGDFPTAADKWVRVREQRAAINAKRK